MTGSMALVADAFHMLSDIVALVIAYISIGKKAFTFSPFVTVTRITFHLFHTYMYMTFPNSGLIDSETDNSLFASKNYFALEIN